MGTIDGMLAQARATLGLGENPPGSNHNKITVWYNANIMHIGDGAWCNMGITYWAAHSDNLKAIFAGPGIGYAYTVWHAQKYQQEGRWHYGTSGIRKGDQIFFNWDRRHVIGEIDHTGYVEKVLGGLIYTIEANKADRCVRVVRDATYVVGYGRPAYSAAAPTPAPKQKEEDMPEYISLADTQALEANAPAVIQWGKEWSDSGSAHPAGTSVILSGGSNGAIFTLTVNTPDDLKWRLIETDPSKDYATSKAYPMRTGSFTENGGCNPRQHLYVEVHPEAAREVSVSVKGHYWHQP